MAWRFSGTSRDPSGLQKGNDRNNRGLIVSIEGILGNYREMGSLGIPRGSKKGMIGTPVICRDSTKGRIRRLGIPRGAKKGMVGTLGFQTGIVGP